MKIKKGRLVILALLGIMIVAVFISLLNSSLNNNDQSKTSQGIDSSQGIGLFPPTVYALGGTPPLDTTTIGLIAYYQRTVGWTLSNTVSAFVSYTEGGNYYDGWVRVWDSRNIGASSTDSENAYIDVKVRVRADGWIMAWFNRTTDDPGAIVWWGHTRDAGGNPPSYSTTLSRAIEIVFEVAGVGFPGYNAIGMYDYSLPSAKRLIIFGRSFSGGNVDYYYTIPSSSSIVPIRLLVRAGGDYSADLTVDGGQVFQRSTSALWGWSTYQLDAQQYMTKNVQHTINQYGSSYGYNNVAFIMWTG